LGIARDPRPLGVAIRELTLDDVDLAGRHITLAGHSQRLGEFVHQALLAWLQARGHFRELTPST
jgi:hypothetical protein